MSVPFSPSAEIASALVEGTFVIACALGVARMLHRGTPHTRHALLMGALTVQSLLLLHAAITPSWTWRVLPPVDPGIIWHATGTSNEQAHVSEPSPPEVIATAPAASESGREGRNVGAALAGLWLAGTVLLVFSRMAGLLSAGRIIARSRPVVDPSIVDLFEECCTDLRIRRPVRMVASEEVGVPAITGLISPYVVVPVTSLQWPRARLKAVLLHELAHVGNRDVLNQLLTNVAAAILWPHPLTRLACAAAACERERMADLAALRAGTPRREYVKHVIAVATDLSGHSRAQFVGFATRTTFLERRLSEVLSMKGAPAAPARLLTRVCFAVILAFTSFGLVAMRPSDPQGVSHAAGPSGCDYNGGRHIDRTTRVDGRRHWTVEWHGADCRVRWSVVGDVRLDLTSGRINPVSAGDSVLLEVRGPTQLTVAITSDGISVTRASGNAAEALLDPGPLMPWLIELDRHTAFAVAERLPALAAEGLESLLGELGRMQGSHAAATYAMHALEAMSLTDENVAQILRELRRHPANDAVLENLLLRVAEHYSAQFEPIRTEYLTLARSIEAAAAIDRVRTALAN